MANITHSLNKTILSVVSLHDESDEKQYWHSRTPLERLEALEHFRQVMYGYNPTTERLQRFFEVVERKRS
jgi:hypothetical protein